MRKKNQRNRSKRHKAPKNSEAKKRSFDMSSGRANSSGRAPEGPKLNFKRKKSLIICRLTSVKKVKRNTTGKISTSKNPSGTHSTKPRCSGATSSTSSKTISPSPNIPCSPGSGKISSAAAESHHLFYLSNLYSSHERLFTFRLPALLRIGSHPSASIHARQNCFQTTHQLPMLRRAHKKIILIVDREINRSRF